MRCASLSGIVALALAQAPVMGQDYFTILGNLPGHDSGTDAFGVSDDGFSVAGLGRGSGNSLQRAFRWTRFGFHGLEDFPGGDDYCHAYAVSGDGMTIVGSGSVGDFGPETACLWSADGSILALGDPPDGSTARQAIAVSDDGSVIVGIALGGGLPRAFRWTAAGGSVGLGLLPGGDRAYPEAVSADGSVVVGGAKSASYSTQAFRWTEADGLVGLGVLPDDESSSAGVVSADGTVIAGWGYDEWWDAYQMFRWTETDGFVSLGTPGDGGYGQVPIPTGITADGTLIVGSLYDINYYEDHAFIWTADDGYRWFEDVMADYGVDLSAWSDILIEDMSSDGQFFVGTGWNPDTGREAFLARIPIAPRLLLSEPAAGAVLRTPGGVDHASLVWTYDVVVDAGDVSVLDMLGQPVGFTLWSPKSDLIRIDFDTALEADAYTITVADTATDTSGVPIDGDADGTPGGDLVLTLTHLCPGDHNGDGDINTLDVLAFLNSWNAGCP